VLLVLVLSPVPFALLCLALPASLLRRLTFVVGAAVHFAIVMQTWAHPAAPMGLLELDPLAHLFVTLISLLFLATSIYFVGYHQQALLSQRVFLACMLALLTTLTLVCASQHLGLLWVALEASSLAATPLIYFRLGPRALAASWQFLLLNSVGIALALMGIFCVALATTPLHEPIPLTIAALIHSGARMDPTWLRVGFLLALVGFGTKMGLAPLQTWKPDAYGEAPPPVAAILAGAMTLGGFIGLLRIYQICAAAGQASFAGSWMIIFGLLSIATAALFIIGGTNYRRMLAYTSVEHMGVLVLGVGLNSAGQHAAMLHAMHNTLNKGALFFLAGFLWRIYRSNRINDVRGAVHRHPAAGILLLAALCATSGLPPFGMFFSEFGILLAAVQQSQWTVAIVFVITLAVVFVGLMTAMLPMAFGRPPEPVEPAPSQMPGWSWRQPVMLIPTAGLVLLGLLLGPYQPKPIRDALRDAGRCLDTAHSVHVETVASGQEGKP
jgi:hydrogenase-4 component F